MTDDTRSQAAVEPRAPLDHTTARRRRGGTDPDKAIKGLAKAIARDATSQISDRHLRARVRTRCYNQMVGVLRRWDDQRAVQRARYRRTLTVLGSATMLMGAALAVSLAL